IMLRFESAAKPDFSAIERRSPAWVKSAGWHLDGTATVVEFETDAESVFHDFREVNRIAIDVLAPKTDASAYAPPGQVGPSVSPNPPPKSSDAAAALKNARPAPPAHVAPAPRPSEMASANAELTREGAALHFPAARGHAAAVFLRGETLWIVLDSHPALDAATLLAPIANLLSKAEAEQTAGAAVLKLVFKAPLLPSVQESESALNVVLTAGATMPPDAIA